MAAKLQHIQNLRHIFLQSLEAVRPAQLLSAANNYDLRPVPAGGALNIRIQGETLNIAAKRCHVVGFGKAVLGMAVHLERALQQHLVGGVLSVPVGTLQQFEGVADMQLAPDSVVSVVEGAPHNQPDEQALSAARRIKQLASSMRSDDVLFVLISGGGSALLPLPRAPITLPQKMELVRQLANCGASIEELNVVRIALSDIKGGRLAAAARQAHAVISLVISDIVGDPVDLIASGPTCGTQTHRHTAKAVLQKYALWANQPPSLQRLIETPVPVADTQPGVNSAIYVVGDNRVAAARAVQEALRCSYNPFIASTALQGDVRQLVEMYGAFLRSVCAFRGKRIGEQQLRDDFPFEPRLCEPFLKTLLMCERTAKPLLLILAGEPTVKVTGTGLGGRNQELALRMALELYGGEPGGEFDHVYFLSAGTDGIDGPTPAAGAIGSSLVLREYLRDAAASVDEVRACLRRNDSYGFFKRLCDGQYHVVTGHTGTNVMDLQLLLVT